MKAKWSINMKWFMATLTILVLSSSVHAAPIEASLYLSKIQALIQNEKGNDEIYFSVIEYSSDRKVNQNYTMPYSSHEHNHSRGTYTGNNISHITLHWNSADLKHLGNVKLWHKKLTNGQKVEVYLSLIEHDAAPFGLDDSIGAIKIQFYNKDNKLLTKWGYLGNDKMSKVNVKKNAQTHKHEYLFEGSGSKYLVSFQLKHLLLSKLS